MANRTQVAVIGGGNMGRHHIRNYSEMDSVDLVGIADSNPETRELAERFDVPHYLDYAEMVEGNRVDAISIVVPTEFHAKLTMDMLRRGIHTLVEKPISSTVDEGEEMMREAEIQDLVLTVGHVERYNPLIKAIKEIVEEGDIGNVKTLTTTRIGALPNHEPRTDVISDLAIHDLDIVKFLLDQPIRLLAAHGSRTYHSREIDSAEIMLSSNGTSAMVQANWVSPVKVRDIRMIGEGGFVKGNYITQELEYWRNGLIDEGEDFDDYVRRLGDPKKIIRKLDTKEPLREELDAFITAVKTGDTESVMPPSDAIEALRIAIAAKELALRGMRENV